MKILLLLLLLSIPAYAQTYNPPGSSSAWSPNMGNPSISVGSAAGSGASASVTGTNVSGTISVSTGSATLSGALLATITFNGTVLTAPNNCTLFPQNTNSVGQVAMVYATQPATSGWSIGIGGSALPANITSYQWGYTCN